MSSTYIYFLTSLQEIVNLGSSIIMHTSSPILPELDVLVIVAHVLIEGCLLRYHHHALLL